MPEKSPFVDDPMLIQRIIPFARSRICREGEKIMDTGASSDCFYFVEEGVFEVSYLSGETPIVVAMIGEGAFIGEIGFFDRKSRTRYIKAVGKARLRVFDNAVLANIRGDAPLLYGQFLEYILRSVCGRFRQILADRGPLTAYAASLSTGKEVFQGVRPLPADLLGSRIWREIGQHIELFKAEMFDIAYRLQKEDSSAIPDQLQAKGRTALDQLKENVRQFGPYIEQDQAAGLMWGYVFKEVFPYLMRSRFAERAYYKPKGYAGDFMMIEWIYRNEPKGDGKLGRLIDSWVLNQIPARCVRSRRILLGNLLGQLCRQRQQQSELIRIMNLACGPCRELFDMIGQCEFHHKIEATCIDIDPEALAYADRQVDAGGHGAAVRYMRENVVKWATGRIKHDFVPQDIIYSSGLCDYLDHQLASALIERCYHHLKPGGVLIIGNFSPSNPDKHFMDQLLYWRLIHRDARDLKKLFSGSSFNTVPEIIAEDEAVSLFAVAQRRA